MPLAGTDLWLAPDDSFVARVMRENEAALQLSQDMATVAKVDGRYFVVADEIVREIRRRWQERSLI